MISTFRPFAAFAMLAVLAGCASEGDLVVSEGVEITAIRTTCPAVGVPDYTGNITTFRAPHARTGGPVKCAEPRPSRREAKYPPLRTLAVTVAGWSRQV